MATIQQSIEIKVPVQTAYNQLTQFEDYPRFMENVEAVQQIDDTHLHWTTVMSNHSVEWDAEITEQEPDRCIAWHNISDPASAGKVEVQSAGSNASRVIFTLQAAGSPAGNNEQEMAQRLKQDLARLKDFIEARRSATGAWRGEVHDAQVTMRDRDAKRQEQENGGNAPAAASGYAAGSEGWSGDEDPAAPVVSSSRMTAEQRDDFAESVSRRPAPSPSDAGEGNPQINASTQSDYSLSRPSDDGSADDGRFSIAEEVSFDQQSDAARNIGHMPQDTSADHHGGTSAPDAMRKTLQQDEQDAKDNAKLKPSIDRAVPPSE
ncbi:MAG: hypothetical protein A3I66_10625 [Burkholderiales bacterium RIFCSPLOWO2_02_FULL_57_36]|nr:MAG: hypothetical protein A3I66_10625 [Burkholderiales bacterium RIFCSPLOWO2_02_FULL_57_36]